MHTFASVAVVDSRGWVLMQERDEHALHDPERWGLPGGDLEDGEDFRAAAVRELAEETGLVVEPDRLESLGTTRFHSESCGGEDEFELFAVRLDVTDDDVVCGEGRRGGLRRSRDRRRPGPAPGGTPRPPARARVAPRPRRIGSAVRAARPRGRRRTPAHAGARRARAALARHRWCFPGGGLERGEEPVAGAVRELAEETGVVLAPEDLTDRGRFELVHR